MGRGNKYLGFDAVNILVHISMNMLTASILSLNGYRYRFVKLIPMPIIGIGICIGYTDLADYRSIPNTNVYRIQPTRKYFEYLTIGQHYSIQSNLFFVSKTRNTTSKPSRKLKFGLPATIDPTRRYIK